MSRAVRCLFCLLLSLFLCIGSLVGCQRQGDKPKNEIVCTTFAAYDWARAILGETDTLRATLLVADGSDLHSYQPTVADKVTLAESALVVRVGGESDRWVADMAPDSRTLCLSELGGITLRMAETMNGGDGHDHVHVHGEDEEHGHDHDHRHDHASYDEHLWLSPKNAWLCVSALADTLCALDTANAEIYRENAAAYTDQLYALDAAFAAACAAAPRRELLVADRFPFVYLVEEYGLTYCAAFAGCSTESQASFDTVVRLAKQADAWELTHLLVTEGSDRRLATSVVAATESKAVTVLAMDSMQAVSAARAASGVTYLSVMYENLEILRTVLS